VRCSTQTPLRASSSSTTLLDLHNSEKVDDA
jgi:hypothetical protein